MSSNRIHRGAVDALNYVWDGTKWVEETPGGGGGGGGAVTVADGADVTQGAIADPRVTGDNVGTISAKLRGINAILDSVWSAGADSEFLITSGSASQGGAAPLVGAWPVIVTDGTNVQPTGDSSARSIHTTTDNGSDRTRQTQISDGAGNARSANVTAANELTVAGTFTPADGVVTPTKAVPVEAFLMGFDDGTGQNNRVRVDDVGRVAVVGSTTGGAVVVAGTHTPIDGAAPTDAVDTFALLGGYDAGLSAWRRVQVDTGTGTLKVNPGTVTTNPPAHASTNVDQVGGAGVTLGAKTSANSIPVVLATDEATLPVSAASLPLPANAAVESGGHLATIDTNIAASKVDLDTSLNLAYQNAAYNRLSAQLLGQQVLFLTAQPANGFVPVEVPAFLTGL